MNAVLAATPVFCLDHPKLAMCPHAQRQFKAKLKPRIKESLKYSNFTGF